MSHARITRRKLMKTAGAAVPLLAASLASGGQDAKPGTGPIIGISTLGFPKHTNAQLAEELAGRGIRVVQLFLSQSDSSYWKYNGRSDLSDLTASRCEAIARAYRSAGVAIHSIGVYTNLTHGDPAERQACLAYFDDMMKVGGQMGVRTFITEAGHWEPEKPTPGLPYHFRAAVWQQMLATGKQLAEMAERHDATVLMEPSFASLLASAKRTRLFLQEVNSPRIRALLDPANLLEVDDLEEMFDQLTPWIDCHHAKDRKLHVDQGVAAGQGDLDYRQFVTLASKRTPKAPLILEYVGPENYQQALHHLQNALREAGASEEPTETRKRALSEEQIINAANGAARQHSWDPEKCNITYDEGNARWSKIKRGEGIAPTVPIPRMPELEGHDYQVVIYTRRTIKPIPAGDFWVMVDRNTGEVLMTIEGG